MHDAAKENKQSSWRFETKYRVSFFDYHKIRAALRPHMKEDYYTRSSMTGRYLVRSLYYDTYDYRLYHEKMSGDHERVKLRLRTYSQTPQSDSAIKAEMKVRKGNAMEKHSVIITLADGQHFIQKKQWYLNNNPVLQEFERCVHLLALNPQVLVEYFREGYEDRARSNLRITFDRKIRGAQSLELFPPSPVFWREFHPQVIVLEIKSREDLPWWLRHIIREYGLKWVANSKFTQAIQTARHDLYYPGGIVVVR